MKVAVLCIFGALCVICVDATDVLHKLKDELKMYERTIEAVKEDLEDYEYQYTEQLELELGEDILSPVSGIDKIIREAHNEFRILHENLEYDDDVQACYTSTLEWLYYIEEKGNSDLNVCVILSLTHLDSILEVMSDAIKSADKQMRDMNIIIPECEQQETSVESCLEYNIEEARKNLIALASKIDEIKNEAQFTYTETLQTGRSCIEETLKEVQTSIHNTMSDGRQCIENINE